MDAIINEPKVWIALSFVIFMAGFFRYALPFILRALDKRSDAIQHELDEAVRLREEAQSLLASYQTKQKEMMAEAENILIHARQEAEAMRAHAKEQLEAAVARRTKLAHEKIARAENEAVADIRGMMVDIAVSTAREAFQQQLSSDKKASTTLDDATLKDAARIVH